VEIVSKMDPSGNHKYLTFLLEWIKHATLMMGSGLPMMAVIDPTSFLADSRIDNVLDSLEHNIKVYHEKQNIPDTFRHKDLNDYFRKGNKGSWPIDFLEDVRGASNKISASQAKKLKKQGIKLYEDNKWLVIVPLSHQASCFYGAETKWCTATKDKDSYYNQYKKNGELYYVINKKSDKSNPYHKMALNFTLNDVELYNAPDTLSKLTALVDEGVPKEALLKIVENASEKNLHLKRFINLLGIEEASPMLYKKYKDDPVMLLSSLGFDSIEKMMGETKAQRWLMKNIKNGSLNIEGTGGDMSDFVKSHPLVATIISMKTGEYIPDVALIQGAEQAHNLKPAETKKVRDWAFNQLKERDLLNDVIKEGDKYYVHTDLESVGDLFGNERNFALALMGEDWPDMYDSYGGWAPDTQEMWDDFLDGRSKQEIRQYLYNEYGSDYEEMDFMKMDGDDVVNFIDDTATDMYDSIVDTYHQANQEAKTSIMIQYAFDELADAFGAEAQRHYQNEDNMFKFPIQPDTMWSTLNEFTLDLDWSYTSGAIDETEYVDIMVSLMDSDFMGWLDIDKDPDADDEEILNAGFNEIFIDHYVFH